MEGEKYMIMIILLVFQNNHKNLLKKYKNNECKKIKSIK